MTSTSVAIAVTFATLVLVAAPAELQDRKAGGPSRQRPPEGFACVMNDVTAYTGVVVRYQREPERTTLRICTDCDTTEEVAVPYSAAADPAASFRYAAGRSTRKTVSAPSRLPVSMETIAVGSFPCD